MGKKGVNKGEDEDTWAKRGLTRRMKIHRQKKQQVIEMDEKYEQERVSKSDV